MLEHLLREEIQKTGPLSQSRFMEISLQHPTYGYYRTQEAISQDFTTAPEISQIFGELLGLWAIDFYQKLGNPKKTSLIELGPGKGTLMTDLLRTAKVYPSFYESLDLHFIETNSLLRNKQRKTLRHSAKWGERFEDIPLSFAPLLIIANEFFDCLPVNYYVRKKNVLYERRINFEKKKLVFVLIPLKEQKGKDESWEESPMSKSLVKNICSYLSKQSGAFLCIDYGYAQGTGDSLQALHKGKPSPPLSLIGKSDLTCHVNFTTFREIALDNNLGVWGPIPQGQFLSNLGLEQRLQILKQQNPISSSNLEAGALRLIHPQQMGALFQVMAVTTSPTLSPIGFDS